MSKITLYIKGVAAELVLGNYMPKDPAIFENWEEFYHYNDLIHESQLLSNHISEIQILVDDESVFTGNIPASQFIVQKSISPVMVHRALYLRTECVEQADFQCVFDVGNFDKRKLFFETQDYDLLFKVGNSFLSKIKYEDVEIKPEWKKGTPVGNLCMLCRFENGYLIPLYDAVNKIERK